MNSLIENDDEFARGDRELTLSTGAILGIFVGLALLCGLFFGFGYKMGSHKSAPPADAESSRTAATQAAPTADFNAFKPAAGSPAATSDSKPAVPGISGNATGSAAASGPRAATKGDRSAAAAIIPAASVQPADTPNAGGASAGDFVVQIAAVTLQEDAGLLVGALRSKGYAATEHAQPDKLIHIQVGPFGNRKEAESMRQRLLADGYNAIVK